MRKAAGSSGTVSGTAASSAVPGSAVPDGAAVEGAPEALRALEGEAPLSAEELAAYKEEITECKRLREAAMREPDPAVRDKLWQEYRKYKGIEEPGS